MHKSVKVGWTRSIHSLTSHLRQRVRSFRSLSIHLLLVLISLHYDLALAASGWNANRASPQRCNVRTSSPLNRCRPSPFCLPPPSPSPFAFSDNPRHWDLASAPAQDPVESADTTADSHPTPERASSARAHTSTRQRSRDLAIALRTP
jgi:hypothetical protein